MNNWRLNILALAILVQAPLVVNAQIPRTLSYQGVLTDSSGIPKPDGQYALTFRLYDTSAGGTALWTEARVIPVNRGLFHTILGSEIPFADTVLFDRAYWMSIQVANDPELSPRISLTPSAYSISSINAARFRDPAGESLRFLRGTFNTSGSILAGSGFTVSRNGGGDVTVTFSVPFSQQPTAVATAYIVAPAALTTVISEIGTTSVRILLLNSSGVPQDAVIGFIVMGPP